MTPAAPRRALAPSPRRRLGVGGGAALCYKVGLTFDADRSWRKGELVVLVGSCLPAGTDPLPMSLLLTRDRNFLPWRPRQVLSAEELEDGLRPPPGAVIEIPSWAALGTRRQPTRFGAWLGKLASCRTMLVVAGEDDEAEIRRWVPPHLVLRPDQAAGWFAALAGQAGAAQLRWPPPLPGVSSWAGLSALALAGAAAVSSWLLLYLLYGGAQNWPWVRLIPAALGAGAGLLILAPLAAQAARGLQLGAAECYSRSMARWSRGRRAVLASLALAALAAAPAWLAWRYARVTFVVMHEPAAVSIDGRHLGVCHAEAPCLLAVPRLTHLHFDGADIGCGLDLGPGRAFVFIDLDQESCELPEQSEGQSPRG